MILPGQTIREMCSGAYGQRPMLEPFIERSVAHGMSYGLSVAGYDVRIAQDITIGPGEFILASTLERFAMPTDIIGKVHDKSTWARRGIAVQNTIIEPGWRGFLTLEITNHGKSFIDFSEGMPIAQIVFQRLEQAAESPYSGKYQDQSFGPVGAIMEMTKIKVKEAYPPEHKSVWANWYSPADSYPTRKDADKWAAPGRTHVLEIITEDGKPVDVKVHEVEK